jgi:hypothetical protein
MGFSLFNVVRASALFSLTLITFSANADNFVKHTSSVDGIGLWWLGRDNPAASDVFQNGESGSFVSYCNGKNRVYIYELGSKDFACRSRKNGKEDWEKDFTYTIEVLGAESELNNMGDIYTVSKRKIEQTDWKVSPLTMSEIDTIRNMALTHVHRKSDRTGYKYQSIVGKRLDLAKKISVNSIEIMIVPTEHIEGLDGNDSDVMSTVFAKIGGATKYLGSMTGCLKRIGADIDGDGIPDVLTDSCEASESQFFQYFKIYPVVKKMIQYSHG